jgi:hypothetical protein
LGTKKIYVQMPGQAVSMLIKKEEKIINNQESVS